MIVADTGAILALIDTSDRHHDDVLGLYDDDPAQWILPWAILPEVDYLVGAHIGEKAQRAWLEDLATGAFQIEWGVDADVKRAQDIVRRYRSLRLGLVDAIVMSTAERLRATAIATIDLKHFGAVRLEGSPQLVPRDL